MKFLFLFAPQLRLSTQNTESPQADYPQPSDASEFSDRRKKVRRDLHP
jgi:hypothetical protein